MTETKGKKALSLCILRVLEQHAGKAQPLSTRHIIEYLKNDFGMIAERKAVGRNLLLLQEMGFPLSTYQENGKGYYLIASEPPAAPEQPLPFDPAALDAYLRAPRSAQTERAIARLQDDVPIYVADAERVKQDAGVFAALSVLKTAIRTGMQVSFRYLVVQPNGKKAPQRETPFSVSPYALFLAEGSYYVIVSVSGYGRLLHYRCDLMEDLKLTDQPVRESSTMVECMNGLDVAAYVNRTIYHTDVKETHTVQCAEHLAGDLIDAFGDAVRLKPEGETIRAEIDAPWEPIRRFLCNHLKHATLLAPAWRRAQMREELLSALSTYPQE
ncbi:MAG: WYL domain-containing protein [Clostridia bacterium]|nr:WYL domain-containing protein [Clostridia bacterium]MBR3038399.1 WYL domain-containing protein [Clostridia bacterium]MBR3129945.1 WYL domain-containing protein [Clostridia bacterium]